jgi:hypothetical protein
MTVSETLAAQMRAYGALLNEIVGKLGEVASEAHELDVATTAAVNDWASGARTRLVAHFGEIGAIHELLRSSPTAPDSATLASMLATLQAFSPPAELEGLRVIGGQLPPQSVPRQLAGQLFKVGFPGLADARAKLVTAVAQTTADPESPQEQPGAGAAAAGLGATGSSDFPAGRLPQCVQEQLATVGYRRDWLIVESHGGATIADKERRPVLHGTPLNVAALSEGQVSHLQSQIVPAAVAYGIAHGHEIEVGDDFVPLDAELGVELGD